MTRPGIRTGLVALAVPDTVLAVWLLSPRSFYESVPGFGVHWVKPMGAYSRHGFRAAEELSAQTGVGNRFLRLSGLCLRSCRGAGAGE